MLKGKRGLLRQRLGFTVDRVHGGGLRKRTAEITLTKSDGRDRSSLRRFTRHGDNDVSGDVITGDGSDDACSPVNDGAAARTDGTYGLRTTRRTHQGPKQRRKINRRRRRRGRSGGDLRLDDDGGAPVTYGDDGGVDERRRRPERRRRTAVRTAATAALSYTALGLYQRRETKAKVAVGSGGLGGPFIAAKGRRRRTTATGDGDGKLGFGRERLIRIELESTNFQKKLADDSKREKIEEIKAIISPLLISPEKERRDRIGRAAAATRGVARARRREEEDESDKSAPPYSGRGRTRVG
uniref:Uncharacterized protein n=1 Tax=Oryza sativa subsp. japonica TaxID=39947 RepID=Q8H4U1_ORYSJ|nr:hypothetical protein [Oryza sativa Japonica Group]BAD31703.1 hypothetical protein [Oryza sativa Japonica Group]